MASIRVCVAWDLAGAIMEWDLDGARETTLLDAYLRKGGKPIPEALLIFHTVAYAAFRMWQCKLSADSAAHDPADEARLSSDDDYYKSVLARLLDAQPPSYIIDT